MQENMKHNNIRIIGIPEGEEEEQWIENLFDTNPREPMHPNVHISTIYNSQVLEAT